MFKKCFALLLLFTANCYAIDGGYESIGRIEAYSKKGFASGTGFVVASAPNSFTIFSCGHCFERTGQWVAFRIRIGKRNERLYAGKVVAVDRSEGRDVGIVKCYGKFEGEPLKLSKGNGGNVAFTAGYPSGGNLVDLRIVASEGPCPDGFDCWIPGSIPGQSGSPVWDQAGVFAILCGTTIGRQRKTVVKPIGDWEKIRETETGEQEKQNVLDAGVEVVLESE